MILFVLCCDLESVGEYASGIDGCLGYMIIDLWSRDLHVIHIDSSHP